MSTNRFNPKRGWCNPKALPRGPNGRALCRKCNTEVPKGRLSFCSDRCVDAWKIQSQPQYVRNRLYERDKGVCVNCGLDCRAVIKELEKLDEYFEEHQHKCGWGWDYEHRIRTNQPLMTKLGELGISVHRYLHRRREGIWDADHIVPVIEGGGETNLEGFRTLCCRCHKDETAKLRKRRLKEKGTQNVCPHRGGTN